MGRYHVNLTDEAVLNRVKGMTENNSHELFFAVPKARKRFLIKRITELDTTENTVKVFDSIYGFFSISEVPYRKEKN